jgi:glycerol-3-phosphate acyltransferase PlsY
VTLAAAAVLVASFLIGGIPFGVLVSRAFFGRDIREQGSGNIGAANALRTLGKGGAIAVLLLDALKGAAAVWLGRAVAGDALAGSAALLAVVGHCWSPFLRGRGGKGVATSFGAICALAWPAGLAFAGVWLSIVIVSGYASVASLTASIAMGPALGLVLGSPGWTYGVASAAIIIYKHRENLGRLRAGTENVLPLFGRGKSKA